MLSVGTPTTFRMLLLHVWNISKLEFIYFKCNKSTRRKRTESSLIKSKAVLKLHKIKLYCTVCESCQCHEIHFVALRWNKVSSFILWYKYRRQLSHQYPQFALQCNDFFFKSQKIISAPSVLDRGCSCKINTYCGITPI